MNFSAVLWGILGAMAGMEQGWLKADSAAVGLLVPFPTNLKFPV